MPDNDRKRSQVQQDVLKPSEPDARTEREQQTNHCIDARLQQNAGQKRADRRGRAAVSFGQPGVERYDRDLDRETDQQEPQDRTPHGRISAAEHLGSLPQVERTRCTIGQPDGQQNENTGDGRIQHISERGFHGAWILRESN